MVDEVDLSGDWYVRKALRLYCALNPAFVEWVQSPIIYPGGEMEMAQLNKLFHMGLNEKQD